MPTYPEWEREVLEECYENVEYISLHKYFGNSSRDTLNYFGKIEETGRYIQAIAGVIDCVKAKKRIEERRLHLLRRVERLVPQPRGRTRSAGGRWDWPEAPALLEEDYNLEDALFIGGLLNEFIRRTDRVKIACIAQLVNVIAPIRTETGGRAWKTSIYYPYQFASLYGRGTALNVAVDAPTYDCEVEHDVSFLDVAAVDNAGDGMVTVFILNRHLDRGDGARHGPPRLRRADAGQAPDHGRPGPGPARGQHRRRSPDRSRRATARASASRTAGWLARCRRLSYHVVRLRAA